MMNRFQMSDIDKTANIHFIGIGGISMSVRWYKIV